MKQTIPAALLLLTVSFFIAGSRAIFFDKNGSAIASEWKSLGGNFKRTGLSENMGPESGCVKWQFDTDGPVSASVTVSLDKRVHIASEDGNVYALDANGVLLQQSGGAINHLIFQGKVYDSSFDCYGSNGMYYDPQTGRFLISQLRNVD